MSKHICYTDNGITPPISEPAARTVSAGSVLAELGAAVVEDCPLEVESSVELRRAIFVADGGAGVQNLLQKLGTEQMHPFLESAGSDPLFRKSGYVPGRVGATWSFPLFK